MSLSSQMRRVWMAPLLAALALAGAGCSDSGRARSPVKKHKLPFSSKADQVDYVRQVVWDFYTSYTRADGRWLCRLMTPAMRAQLLDVVHTAMPDTTSMPCGRATMRFFTEFPVDDQPPAINQADHVFGDYRFDAIEIRGRVARVDFPGDSDWTLRLFRNDWLIDSFPILPRTITKELAKPA